MTDAECEDLGRRILAYAGLREVWRLGGRGFDLCTSRGYDWACFYCSWRQLVMGSKKAILPISDVLGRYKVLPSGRKWDFGRVSPEELALVLAARGF